jgi:hypothetical protein
MRIENFEKLMEQQKAQQLLPLTFFFVNKNATQKITLEFKLDVVLRILWLKIEINMKFKLIHAMNSLLLHSVLKFCRVAKRLRSFIVVQTRKYCVKKALRGT